MYRYKDEKGFTLIELLVVIAVIMMLLGLLMPALRGAKAMTYKLRCTNNLRQLNLVFGFYLNDNEDQYPCADDPVSTDPYCWLWMGRGWRGFVEPYIENIRKDYANSVLFCPIDRKSKEKYEGTSYAYSMAFYHSSDQIDQMNDKSFTWSNAKESVVRTQFMVDKPDSKIMIGEWLSSHHQIDNDPAWWGWEGTRNFLFADGSIRYLRAKQIHPANDGFPDANLTKEGLKGIDSRPGEKYEYDPNDSSEI